MQTINAELFHHLRQPVCAGFTAGYQRIDVALIAYRFARIGLDDVQQQRVDIARIHQFAGRDQQAFVIDIGPFRSHAEATEIYKMRGAGGVTDHAPVVKHRHQQKQVVQVPGGYPRIVGDVYVARLHLVPRKATQHGFDRFRHRVDVSGRACHGLGQHAALHVKYPGGDIPAFTHNRAESRTDQGLALLFDNGQKTVPHDLQSRVCRFHDGSDLVRSNQRLPPASTRASKSALTYVVVCGSVTKAGPAITSPGLNAARSNTPALR